MIRALVDFALKNRWLVLGGAVLLTAWGVIVLPQPAHRGLSRRRQQLRPDHHPVARPLRRRDRAPGHRARRNPDGRHPSPRPSALHHARRPLQPHADLRRRLHQRHESRARARAPQPGHPARQPQSPDGHRLEPRRPDLLVHPRKHQPRLRRDGEEVARRLDAREVLQERRRASSMSPASAAPPRSTRSASTPTSSSPTAFPSPRSSSSSPTTIPTAAAASSRKARSRSTSSRIGLYHDRPGHREHRCQDVRTAPRSRSAISPPSNRAPRFASARSAARTHHSRRQAIVDNPDTVEGIVLLQKGDDSDPVLQGIHEEVEKLNGTRSPASCPRASRSFPSSIAPTWSTTPSTPSNTTSPRA